MWFGDYNKREQIMPVLAECWIFYRTDVSRQPCTVPKFSTLRMVKLWHNVFCRLDLKTDLETVLVQKNHLLQYWTAGTLVSGHIILEL